MLLLFIVLASVAAYLWFKPHRNITEAPADAAVSVTVLTQAFISNEDSANHAYLSTDGNSKILQVSGIAGKSGKDAKGHSYLELKSAETQTGFTAFLLDGADTALAGIRQGQVITVKGAIVSGNRYDKDLEFHEPGVLTQCIIVKKSS